MPRHRTFLTDIVSLARLRHETRQPSTHTAHDNYLIELLSDAFAFVSKEISRPLFPVSEVVSIAIPSQSDCPIYLFVSDVIAISQFKYWSQDIKIRDNADGTISIDLLGRLEKLRYDLYKVYPPDTGWPVTLKGSRFQLMISRHYPISVDNQNNGLIRAIVAHVREAYDGNINDKTNMAIRNLIRNSDVRSEG